MTLFSLIFLYICRLEKNRIKERLEKIVLENGADDNEISTTNQNKKINISYFWQMLASPVNLTPVFASCHERSKHNHLQIDESQVFIDASMETVDNSEIVESFGRYEYDGS